MDDRQNCDLLPTLVGLVRLLERRSDFWESCTSLSDVAHVAPGSVQYQSLS